MPNHSDYCASKFAVRGFTEALMVELTGSNVAVHLVHPGGIRTNIASGVEGGEELTENFLTTSPSDLVLHVIAGVKKGKQRIVYGNQSFSMWFSSWAMPLERRNKVIYGQMKNMFDQRFYQQVKRKLS
jgi:butyryl-CoA dehydrogenase